MTGRQGTAARSPKRTAGPGDARGRPTGIVRARDVPSPLPLTTACTTDPRRDPPAPLRGTGAALTPVLAEEGPRGHAPRGPSHAGPSHAGPSHAEPSHAGPSHMGLSVYGDLHMCGAGHIKIP
ncbi:hypothetical protein B5181_21550 [Streptomyces sp. 4F]|nr:hypothetical protein B5181_21550 [Streptomyces sp. 4F]